MGKKNSGNCIYVTMSSYDGAKVFTPVLSNLANSTSKESLGLNRDDGLSLIGHENGKKPVRII